MNAQAGAGSQPATSEPLTPGELLRREREGRGMSLQQAAEDLRLDPATVEAIEANRFAALGAPVYARGHLRKYATLLGLSTAVVIERYEALQDTPSVPTPIPPTLATSIGGIGAPPARRAPLWIVAAIVVVGTIWFAIVQFSAYQARRAEEAPAPVATPAAEAPAAPVTVEPSAPAPTSAQTPAEPARSSVAAPPAAASATREVRLTLEFSEPSWTEIYDAAGNRLMFDTGVPGRARTVTGAAPLRVTLGLAAAVSARVNDRDLVIPRRTGKDAAKFLVEADGSVRVDSSRQNVSGEEASE